VKADGHLTDDLRAGIREVLRRALSPRHAPDRIEQVRAIPRTLSGKRVEVPVKRILQGADPETVLDRSSLRDPSSIDEFVRLAPQLVRVQPR